MTDIAKLKELRERVIAAKGPDRRLDYELFTFFAVKEASNIWDPKVGNEFTASIDIIAALFSRILPGWWWSCGTCCVSDDARMAPDFNSPIHGERLKAEFFPLVAGSEFDAGFDVDRRPPGNVPLAMLEAMLSALIAQAERAGE